MSLDLHEPGSIGRPILSLLTWRWQQKSKGENPCFLLNSIVGAERMTKGKLATDLHQDLPQTF